jgi:hypothetical protein
MDHFDPLPADIEEAHEILPCELGDRDDPGRYVQREAELHLLQSAFDASEFLWEPKMSEIVHGHDDRRHDPG